MKLYEHTSVEKFIFERLVPAGYEVHQIEGSLVDNWVCIAPDEKHWNFEFKEQHVNEWSSGLSQRRTRRLSKWAEAMLEEEQRRIEEEEARFAEEKKQLAG